MKKRMRLFVLFVMLFSLMLQTKALAAVYTIYANVDVMNVYAEPSRSSNVIKSVPGGTALLVEQEGGEWWGVLCEAASGDGQTLGWVWQGDIALAMPSQYCNHNWSDWQIYSQPTCTEGGMEMRSCSICGVGEGRDIPPLGHEFGDYVVTREATCTQEGQRVRTCARCGVQDAQVIPKADHRFNSWTVTREPTCTQEGEQVHTCMVCGLQERQVLNKLPHTFGDWKVLREPTCTMQGERTHTCVVCKYQENEAIAMLPHDFEWVVIQDTTDHSAGIRAQKCKVCGTIGEQESFDPEGTLRRGARGDDVKEMQQLLADQNYLNANGADGIFGGGTEKALMQFQTDQGLTADGVCWPQTMKRLQHEFGPWTTIEKLARDKDGDRVRVCKDCGFEQHQSIIAMPYIQKGDRSEEVRTVQQILTQLTYNPGSPDGIYGQKMDSAYGEFAKAQAIDFEPGKLWPVHIDALFNAWIESLPEESWKGEGTGDSPVNMALTVMAAMDTVEEQSDDLRTYSWTLTNLGPDPCQFAALLLHYGEDTDYRSDNLVVVLDGEELKENCANNASGSFVVSSDWGSGMMSIAALAINEKDGSVWLSNTVLINSETGEEQVLLESGDGTEDVAETEAEGEPETAADTEETVEETTEAEGVAEVAAE